MASDYELQRAREKARDDAKRDPGPRLIDLFTIGATGDPTYKPPSDPELRAAYDHAYKKAKEGK